MLRVLDRSLERGLLDAVVRRMPAGRQLPLRHRLRRVTRPAILGTLRSHGPVSDNYGFDRGTPVDRYYIEQFLHAHRADIRGHVLEVKDSAYTDRFGAGVTRPDVLDIDASNPNATVVADLSACDSIDDATFDCFVLTQTLQFIADAPAAIAHARRILEPGGVLLVTVPAVSPVAGGRVVDYWRFTVASCVALFGEVFGPEAVAVRSYGSFLTCVAFLAGMAREELKEHELERHDARFALLISVRASRA